MSGKPGRSGGAREGSGPKPKSDPCAIVTEGEMEPMAFLLKVMNDNNVADALRVRAAVCAAQYRHTKREDGGKKEEVQRAADAVAAGKFAPAAPPRLVVSNSG